MPERILFPEWRAEHATVKYPFGDAATLVNDEGFVLLEGTFLDASLYAVGTGAGLYLSRVSIDHRQVTLWVGDPSLPLAAATTFPLVGAPDLLALTDNVGRPAGVLVSESSRLGVFQSWDVGDHDFKPAQSEFAATVCLPVPGPGLLGVLLDDGSLLTGDVYLVGEDGVVVREEVLALPTPDLGPVRPSRGVRVDVVGDPLFRRRLCSPELFTTPNPVRQVRVVSGTTDFVCGPDAWGDLKLTVSSSLTPDPIVRVRTTADGIIVEAVGTPSAG